ncbi:MAG: diguanylate cyclase [Thermoguttaceae bacterium]
MNVSEPSAPPLAALPPTELVPLPPPPMSAERSMAELHALLKELEAAAEASHTLPPVFDETIDDRLVQVRLGTAAGLFAALQCKSAASAGHSLRVALTASAWALRLDLAEADRDAIEVAALLHDVGAIGVPDHILLKPGPLDPAEAASMAHGRAMSMEILRRGQISPKVLDIVRHIPTWYDGSHGERTARGSASIVRVTDNTAPPQAEEKREDVPVAIPLGARMIAIVEAFDAMTTDHVYRPARSQERAMAELFECAGTQFDPGLVERFARFRQEEQASLREDVARRWLRSLDVAIVNSRLELDGVPSRAADPPVAMLFEDRLLDNMYDAVAFVDATGRITTWNRGAERLTGLSGEAVRGHVWQPALLELSDEKGNPVQDADCPVFTAIRCGAQSLRRLTIVGRGRRLLAVDAHAMPVIDRKGVAQGAVLLLHDASSETTLEQQCQSLHEKATKDPLTQVANRAEFDRVHAMFITAHQQQQVPCSLVMCDLDRFKRVNDTYGHQAGDDAIRSLASLLKSSCRPGDLVARYGGEEFVMLCADCDNATAARRAEQVRKALCELPQERMGGRSISVSMGVTEVQPGDTAETMLRRADRGLLMAKAKGRNVVVQLGIGSGATAKADSPGREKPKEALEQELIAPVPVRVAIEKLRGFVADHRARILSIDGNRVQLELDQRAANRLRRLTDRPMKLHVELRLEEQRLGESGTTRTRIKIAVSPERGRNRRREEEMDQARQVLMSFRSYLMAVEASSLPTSGPLKNIARALAPWLIRKK